MAIETKQLERSFRYNSVDLPDPGAQFNAEQVRDLYSGTYPEITTAAIEGPEEKGGKLVYTFRRAVGTKGNVSNQITVLAGVRGKRCSGCKLHKPLTQYTRGTGPGGFHRHCRFCNQAYRERVKQRKAACAKA